MPPGSKGKPKNNRYDSTYHGTKPSSPQQKSSHAGSLPRNQRLGYVRQVYCLQLQKSRRPEKRNERKIANSADYLARKREYGNARGDRCVYRGDTIQTICLNARNNITYRSSGLPPHFQPNCFSFSFTTAAEPACPRHTDLVNRADHSDGRNMLNNRNVRMVRNTHYGRQQASNACIGEKAWKTDEPA